MAKKPLEKFIQLLRKDTLAIVWIIFIASIIILTFYGKQYLRDMMVLSILFLVFVLLEPLIHTSHAHSFIRWVANGKHVPAWKRFPFFFIAVIIVFGVAKILDNLLDTIFPAGAVNLLFVVLWLVFLFIIYVLIFTKRIRN